MNWRPWVIGVLIACLVILGTAELCALLSKARGDTISEITRDQFAKLGRWALAGFGGICFALGLLVAHLVWWQSAPTNSDAATKSLQSLDR